MEFTGEIPQEKLRSVSLNNLKFSIITICFNAERTIEQTVKSVIGQKYPGIEYIIIDGASTDNTLKILEPYREKIAILESAPDKGLYDAINKGLGKASGDVIGLLHSDDFYANENVIENIARIFGAFAEIEAVNASVDIFKAEQFEIPFRTYDASKFRLWQFRFGMQPPHPGFFIKRGGLEKVGLYNTNYRISGDFDWLLRTLKIHEIKTHYTSYVAVNMRDGGLSSSGFESKRLMNRENLKSLKSHGIYSNILFMYSKYMIKIFQVNLKSFFRK